MEKIDNVNYDDYKYKSYIWKEDGRHKKPEKRKKTKPQKPEKALGIKNLMQSYGLTQEEVAKKLGKSRSTIANSIRV